MPTGMARKATIALIALGVLGGGSVLAYKQFRWKNFAEVAPDRVYRSGQLSEGQLESAIHKLGLRRVVCLNQDEADRERALCGRLGVAFDFYSMPADGRGAVEQFTAIHRLLSDPAAGPVLVHCSAGVARTGVAVALYRVLNEGGTTDRALAELRTFERKGRITVELQQHVRQMALQVGDALRR